MSIKDSHSSFAISKVVLGAKTDNAYGWLQTESFSNGLVILCCQQKILVSKGENLLLPDIALLKNPPFYKGIYKDIVVLDTVPVLNGYLSVTTEVVITKTAAIKESVDVELDHEVQIPPLMVSDFLSCAQDPRSVLPKQRGSHLALDSIGCHDRPFKNIEVQVVPLSSFPKDTEDIHNAVLLNRSTAAQMGLFNGCYIDIQCAKRREKEKSRATKVPRVASVWVHEMKEREPVMKMLPSLWFHLLHRAASLHTDQKKTCFFRKRVLSSCEGVSTSTSWHNPPPFAKEVQISCILSPAYSTGTSYANALQTYFKTPRIVHKGDVLVISLSDDPEFHQEMTDGASSRSPVVYFRIAAISPKAHGRPAFMADCQHTTLVQEGTLNAFIPKMVELSLSNSVSGLEDYEKSAVALLRPFLLSKSKSKNSACLLVTGPSGCGKTSLCASVAKILHMHHYKVNCFDLCSETSSATESRVKNTLQRAVMYGPCVLQLHYVHAIGRDRDGHSEDPRVAASFRQQLTTSLAEAGQWPVVVIATTLSARQLTSDMHDCFLHHINIEVPNEVTRSAILNSSLDGEPCSSDVSVKYLGQRTAGFVLADLNALVSRAKSCAHERLSQLVAGSLSIEDELRLLKAGVVLQHKDFMAAVDDMQAAHSDSIGAPKIPNVRWQDVGGLANVKREILDTIQLPLQHPELLVAGLRRSGVLFYGPPGTGKTLLAKAVATECSLNFLSVKGPELLNMYVGQSEENIREVFEKARSASPCVVFFDELDSLAPNRGRSGDSGGVMDRVVSQLLAELDGMHKSSDVFIIGATNRPDLLDPALLRPGRFDKLLYLGVSDDRDSQLKIIKALTRKFRLHADCDLEAVVSQCHLHMTGADFYALCSDAMLNAMKRKIELLEKGECSTEDQSLEVEFKDFVAALSTLVPSVSAQEMLHYKMLQKQFVGQK